MKGLLKFLVIFVGFICLSCSEDTVIDEVFPETELPISEGQHWKDEGAGYYFHFREGNQCSLQWNTPYASKVFFLKFTLEGNKFQFYPANSGKYNSIQYIGYMTYNGKYRLTILDKTENEILANLYLIEND